MKINLYNAMLILGKISLGVGFKNNFGGMVL
jgi:hypothetical protein